jgi:formylglycine-generating enzyme required for sulfatase activity
LSKQGKQNVIMKTRLHFLFIMLALLAGVRPAPAQVTNLGVALAGNQTVLYWPASVTNSVLQSATNLSSPNWMTVNDAVPVAAVAVANTSPAMFFRLSAPAVPAGMAFIPAGAFIMGDTLDDEMDAVPIIATVSGFYMDTNLVGYSQWQTVYSFGTSHGYGFVHAGAGKATNQPVQTVDWYDAVKWCNARSQQAGLTPAYYADAGFTQAYTNGETTNVFVNWTVNGYRLPTEAEWEKAARGGLSGQRFPWGDTISETNANYFGDTATNYDLGPSGYNSIGSAGGISPATSPVGSFAPNGYGLCDMAGNVFEWCWDWHGTPYAGGSDPHGPGTGTYRVLRGGDWLNNAYFARCAFRNFDSPTDAVNGYGFRCVKGF